MDQTNIIFIHSDQAISAAEILKKYIDQSFLNPFSIKINSETDSISSFSNIHLLLNNEIDENSFLIKSDDKDIYLIAPNQKLLSYAVYTFLEELGFRKYTSKDLYIPKLEKLNYPKNTKTFHKPSFEYRVLYYPDAFNPEFREWHKLDWYRDDFSLWGHSFNKLLPAKDYFVKNPEYFAFFEGERRPESLCMTNKKALKIVINKMEEIIKLNPKASFISVSQNDDIVFCECDQCKIQNKKHGGPQGSLYYFLNKIAKHFPDTKIVTLAYQHTIKAPTYLKLQPNIYTLFCPIEINRGKSIADEPNNSDLKNIIENWKKTTSHLYYWDYTVQFSNYLSPFPNIHTFSDNYKYLMKNNFTGVFAQGSADVPSDFSELKQYLLAKLLWNVDIDIEATTNDFLNGFYGNAAPFIKEYLAELQKNQEDSNRKLDIYSGPIPERKSFLSPKAMDNYDQLIEKAAASVSQDSILYSRVQKLRLSLEFVYFEQSKFYGTDRFGMFSVNEDGQKVVQSSLNERVLQFAETCKELGIYELSEDGISPAKYYENWMEISKNTADHLGENLEVEYINPPTPEYSGKGALSLVDGIKGHTDYNINWIGWYGTNPEFEILTNGLKFNTINLNFLDNQRNWIFAPKKISVYGYLNDKWILVNQKKMVDLVENYKIKSIRTEIFCDDCSNYEKIKITVENQTELPHWRKRKHKKPMVMMDEIELYNH